MEKKRLILWVAGSICALCAAFLPGFSELNRLHNQNEQLLQRVRLLEEHNDKLKGQLFKMKNDPNYVEKKAREKLGIIKKGETIYRPSSKEGEPVE
ncbi:MAG: septum formation initiator family protein [Candidatus Omnitrophota bacterium]